AFSFLRTSSCDFVNRLHPCADCRHGATRNRRAPGSLGRPRRVPREFEGRHGFPGTRRASGGLGGPTNSRRVTGFPGRAERRGVWGADAFEARRGVAGPRRGWGGGGGLSRRRRVTGCWRGPEGGWVGGAGWMGRAAWVRG